jgi:hypothetical protein
MNDAKYIGMDVHQATYKLPRRPRINCRIVSAFVSRMASITRFPRESRTATEIVRLEQIVQPGGPGSFFKGYVTRVLACDSPKMPC